MKSDIGPHSPFGGSATRVSGLPTHALEAMYRDKCGADVGRFFLGLSTLELYECDTTKMRFWRPAEVAGDEAFYQDLSERWPDYYRTDRWEYAAAREAIAKGNRVLEIGCGRGYFLRSIENLAGDSVGLELNTDAIENKVTRFDIRNQLVDAYAAIESGVFDVVCSFQVLEHVADPAGFIRSCLDCVRPGGRLVLSTPNYDTPLHRNQQDAFDLPPHHLNHFTADTFRKIGPLYGLTLQDLRIQVDEIPVKALAVSPASSRLSRGVRYRVNAWLLRLLGTTQLPGHTLVAAFMKPG